MIELKGEVWGFVVVWRSEEGELMLEISRMVDRLDLRVWLS